MEPDEKNAKAWIAEQFAKDALDDVWSYNEYQPIAETIRRAKLGRPRRNVDLEKVEELASLGCTPEEILDSFGVKRTVAYEWINEEHPNHNQEFWAAWRRGHARMKVLIRRQQQSAVLGNKDANAVMLIFLGKQFLGQRDIKEVTGKDGGAIKVNQTIEKGLNEDQVSKIKSQILGIDPKHIERKMADLMTEEIVVTAAKSK